jgi:phosphatidylserine/phosphatidylglycerophosphate/cardiolipin synthase-like enzyme
MKSKSKTFVAGMLSVQFLIPTQFAMASQKAERHTLSQSVLMQSASAFDITDKSSSTLLKDNVNAFEAKLDLIRKAQKSLELQYYIYSDDESSSYFSRELINAANRGVKVRILLDYITNYSNLDLFMAMENSVDKSKGGSLEVRFYNRPTVNIIRDAIYMSTGCSDANNIAGREAACSAEKQAATDQVLASATVSTSAAEKQKALNTNSGFSGVLLSGLYGKSAKTIQFALAAGGKIDLEKLKGGGGELSDKDRESLIELIKVYRSARNGNPFSMVKLLAAEMMYGDKVKGIIGNMDKIFPLAMAGYDDNRGKDWDHITDFLHHKLILADGQEMVLGGRNIENSYHMYTNPSGKYTFMDTDVRVKLNSRGGAQIRASFDRLFNFTSMVATTRDIMTHAPNDVQVVLDSCKEEDLRLCAGQIPRTAEQVRDSRTTRLQAAIAKLQRNAAKYEQNLKVPAAVAESLVIDQGSRLSYLENVPFNKDARRLVRTYGADADQEAEGGKYIHKVWNRAMLDLCNRPTRQTIYLHQAYFIPSSNLMSTMAEMLKTADENTELFGSAYRNLNCSNVTIKVVTNSVETTDLSVINIFARAQMHELFKAAEMARQTARGQRAARLEYYEYKQEEGVSSLHSKVSIIGNKAIIGSANSDVRSFMMDSNNAIFVENAPQFIRDYSDYMERIIADSSKVERLDTQWRNWRNAEQDGLKAEIDAIFARIAEVLKNRKWATAERLEKGKRMFMKYMIEDLRTQTRKMTEMFTNIEPALETEIRKSSAGGRGINKGQRYLRDLEETRKLKRDFDNEHKIL